MAATKRYKPVGRPKRVDGRQLRMNSNQTSVTRIGDMRKRRKVARVKAEERCKTCTSCWPRRGGSWECLSGMSAHSSGHCEEYEFAIFQLVEGWPYSLKQINMMRKAEAEMKKAQGMEVD